MSQPIDRRLWIIAKERPITDEELAPLANLVLPAQRHQQKGCKYEVLTFHTEGDWKNCVDEKGMKQHVLAKFCTYEDAEYFAQKLLFDPITRYFKVVLRV